MAGGLHHPARRALDRYASISKPHRQGCLANRVDAGIEEDRESGGKMNSVKRLFVLATVALGVAQGQTPAGTDPLSGFRPYLIGVSVPNAQEAATWYEQKLGFKRGGSDKTDNGTTLIVEESPGIAVELLQFDGSFSIRRSNPDYDTVSQKLQGIVKIGFAVDNLEAALADLKRKKVRVIREITELKSLNVKFFLIEDNNGNLIQLFQTKKNQAPIEGAANR
jgi:catechol 2,3-dioxygenase-like lactoylglutathione lyase family enzyme